MIRTPQALIPYILAVAVILGGYVWRLGDEMGLGKVVTTGAATIGGPFALTDQNGQVYTNTDLKGHWSLIYFGYTHCPDVCPITLELMSDALQKMGQRARVVTPVFITIDPARDDTKTMKAYVAAFGPRFIGLTGSAPEIAQTLREYHVYAKKRPLKGGDYGMDHSSVIYLMDPNGNFAMAYDEVTDPKKIADDIVKRL
jgi:protein SCO1/2